MLTRICARGAVFLAFFPAVAGAQEIRWVAPVSGNWMDAANWLGGNVPNAPGETAVIDLAGAYIVTQNVAGLSLDALRITSESAILKLGGNTITLAGAGVFNAGLVLNDASTGTIAGPISIAETGHLSIVTGTQLSVNSDIENNGTITIDLSNDGFTSTLRVDQPLTIAGAGTTRLNKGARIIKSGSGHLTLAPGQTVSGRGTISVPLTNNSVVNADTTGSRLSLTSTTTINNGVIKSSAGTLDLTGAVVTQGPTGIVHADGSPVELNNATINGGSVASTAGGVIRSINGTCVLSGVDVEADLQVANESTLVLSGGTYASDNSIVVNSTGSGFSPTLRIDGPLTIGGVGEIQLRSGSRLSRSASGHLTLGPQRTLSGAGLVTATLTNNSIIRASTPGKTLTINATVSNGGVIKADGGKLSIGESTVTQTPAGIIQADGSLVELYYVTIVGGTIDSAGSGLVRTIAGTNFLSAVNLKAAMEMKDGTVLVLTGGTITNDNSIAVNPLGASSNTTLRIDGALSIGGTGQIVLHATGTRAQISAGTGGALTLGSGQTIRGIGQIAVPVTVEGSIAPGLSIGTLAVAATSVVTTWQPTSTLDVELGSLASFDKISGGSHTINGGTVSVTLTDAYAPALFDTHAIIDGAVGSVITGTFDGVTGPTLPAPWVWRIGVLGNDVVVGVSCPSDVNNDFTVDILDFLDFIDDFGSCENQPGPCGNVINADFNGDTFVDILDFLDFIDAFGSGC